MNLPHLVRFLFGHMLVGIVVGWLILGALFWLDVAHLRTLLGQTGAGWIAVPVLAIFFAITFGSLAMGTGIMLLPKDEDDDDWPMTSGGSRSGGQFRFPRSARHRARPAVPPAPSPVPVPVPARPRPRPRR